MKIFNLSGYEIWSDYYWNRHLLMVFKQYLFLKVGLNCSEYYAYKLPLNKVYTVYTGIKKLLSKW